MLIFAANFIAMFFAQNIKFLRKRKGRTQDEVAIALDMKRPTLSGYENGIAEPPMSVLLAFSDYYKISVDTLIRVDLSRLTESQLWQLEHGHDPFVRGTNLRVLATTVNVDNEENIELVNEKAKAGYATGFADPDFVSVLPTFRLPFLSKNKKYRTFQISGDSMLPIPPGAYVTGEFVQNWQTIRSRYPYIILTLSDGIVFKVVENRIDIDGTLRLFSLNPAYEPFDVDIKDVREVWKFVNYMTEQFPEPLATTDAIYGTVNEIRNDVKAIRNKLEI